MKTIFRYANIGLLTAAVFALGAMSGFAQDVCAETDAANALRATYEANYKGTIDKRKEAVEAAKQYVMKYGSCPDFKPFTDYLNKYLPGIESGIQAEIAKNAKDALTSRFNAGLRAKNWNEVYASGKEILVKYPDEFRDAVLVLGSIGLEETAKPTPVTTWNDDTLRYAKMAIADLEAGKTFKTYGLSIKDGVNFQYKNKDDALGWMNYTIGYILFFDKKDKKQGLSYLYKATQMNSDTKTNPVVYGAIGSYYFDEVRRLATEVKTLEAKQDPNATPEAAKALVDEIKAKVAMVNGTAEAAIDAYARARDLAMKSTVVTKEYKDSLGKILTDLYKVRFGKMDGFDAFIASTIRKPMPNPLNPITPISDPEPAPVTTTTTSTTPAAGNKPTGPIRPAAGPAAKPAVAPGKSGAKPSASVSRQ